MLWLLFLVAGLGVGMAALGTLWHTAVQREKEAELLFIGDQYRRAIEHFLNTPPPGQPPRLPQSLDELLLDPRFPETVRHLRRLYPDPMTGTETWGQIKGPEGGISGMHSLSESKPLKTTGFPERYADFAGSNQYRDWKFTQASNPNGSSTAGTPTVNVGTEASKNQPDGNLDEAQQRARFVICIKQRQKAYEACTSAKSPEAITTYYQCRSSANEAFLSCTGGWQP